MKKEPMQKIINTGYQPAIPGIYDFIQGQETGIVYEALNPTGDWGLDLPTKEKQYNSKGDYLDCTSESFTNALEIQLNYRIRNNLINAGFLKFLTDNEYLDENGKVNFSGRALAQMSGTTKLGNTLPQVAYTAHSMGLIPEKKWTPTETMTWEEYYAPVPAKLLTLAKKFLEYCVPMYEWVDINSIQTQVSANALKALKQAPLQITIPIPSHHATCLYFGDNTGAVKIFDTYEPFLFEGDKSYPIQYSLKVVAVQVAPKPVLEKPSYEFTRNLTPGMSGDDVQVWQKVLAYEGYFKYSSFTKFFGQVTKAATQEYQKANGITPTGNLGPQTRANANAKYAPKKKALE